MGLRVYLYDALTDHPFGGNAAGVVLDAATLEPHSMQRIAAELNAPTTGFLVRCEDGPRPTFLVRYFTPRREIALCGHATAAVTGYLAKHRRIPTLDVGELSLRVEQGVEMGRPSSIHVRLTQMAGAVRRVSVCGRAIKTLTGELHCEIAPGQRTPSGQRKT